MIKRMRIWFRFKSIYTSLHLLKTVIRLKYGIIKKMLKSKPNKIGNANIYIKNVLDSLGKK